MVAALAGCGRVGFDTQRGASGDGGLDVTDGRSRPGWSRSRRRSDDVRHLSRPRVLLGAGPTTRSATAPQSIDATPTPSRSPWAGHRRDAGRGARLRDRRRRDRVLLGQRAARQRPSRERDAGRGGRPALARDLDRGGGGFTCAVAAGTAYCWGSDGAGDSATVAPGTRPRRSRSRSPSRRSPSTPANDHAIALLADGTVWSWGHNDSGALGTWTMTPAQTDSRIADPRHGRAARARRVARVRAGDRRRGSAGASARWASSATA